jgi:hypothetical protein
MWVSRKGLGLRTWFEEGEDVWSFRGAEKTGHCHPDDKIKVIDGVSFRYPSLSNESCLFVEGTD